MLDTCRRDDQSTVTVQRDRLTDQVLTVRQHHSDGTSECRTRLHDLLQQPGRIGVPVVLDERWWARDGRRAARLQLVVRGASAEEVAVLALSRAGEWTLEGLYD